MKMCFSEKSLGGHARSYNIQYKIWQTIILYFETLFYNNATFLTLFFVFEIDLNSSGIFEDLLLGYRLQGF